LSVARSSKCAAFPGVDNVQGRLVWFAPFQP
jgi:hypothetical protein